MKDAGVSEANITTGVVARGVADLWDYGSGSGQLSTYFKQRATQLAYRGVTGMGRTFKPSSPFDAAMKLLIPTESKVKGVTKKDFPDPSKVDEVFLDHSGHSEERKP